MVAKEMENGNEAVSENEEAQVEASKGEKENH